MYGRLPWIVGAVAALNLALYAALLGTGNARELAGTIAFYTSSLLAFGFACYAAKRASGRERIAWAGLALTAVTWGFADAGYTYNSMVLDAELPYPNWTDILYYAGYAGFLGAVPLLGLRGVERQDWRSVADAAAVVIVASALAWHFLLEPTYAENQGDLRAAVVASGYPVMDLGLLAAVLLTAYRRTTLVSPVFLALAGSAVAALAADALYTLWLLNAGSVPETTALDLGWMASYWLIAIAAVAPQRTDEAVSKVRDGSALRIALPYAALIPLATLTIAEAVKADTSPVLVTGTVLATLVVILRQWLTLAENVRLHRALASEHARRLATLEQLAGKAIELERMRAKAQILADHDGLTGLVNHRAWFEYGAKLDPRAVALFDIDRFKGINDTYGHPVGDHVLREIAERLTGFLPSAALIGRLGGEEFGVLFRESVAKVESECEEAVRAIGRNPLRLPSGVEVLISVSGGIAACAGGDDMVAAYERSDALLYQAKAAGRNRLQTSLSEPQRRAASA
ncbi:MAG TPA: GGDEF domain-containing protein [Tepidiformaceae bacterium]|nr:GGDEF domain-containing protein [Tepidiformaceae bacterium]